MTSYLRSWLTGAPAAPEPPEILRISPPPDTPDSDDEGEATETEQDYSDVPPAFPALNSAQRMKSSATSSAIPRILTDSDRMPPPPLPKLAVRQPGVGLGVPSAGPGLAPLATTKRVTLTPKQRGKVALSPGHSPLDWAKLKSSGTDLRGVDTLLRVTPSMLKEHRRQDDAWTAIGGKVYNMTAYIDFHPGGVKEIMRCAGRDGTKLFAATHAWVNADYMLDTCLVGFLVSEPSS